MKGNILIDQRDPDFTPYKPEYFKSGDELGFKTIYDTTGQLSIGNQFSGATSTEVIVMNVQNPTDFFLERFFHDLIPILCIVFIMMWLLGKLENND